MLYFVPLCVLYMWKLKLRERKRLGWGHSDPKWLSEVSNPGYVGLCHEIRILIQNSQELVQSDNSKKTTFSLSWKWKCLNFSFHTIWLPPSWQEAHVCNTVGSFHWVGGWRFMGRSFPNLLRTGSSSGLYYAAFSLRFFFFFYMRKQMLLMMERDRLYPQSFSKWHITSISSSNNKNIHLLWSDWKLQ